LHEGKIEAQLLQVYDDYAAKLQQYATSLVRDAAFAQDAVQEVFLRYAMMLREGREITNPKAWLFRVLRNYILDSVKSARVRNEVGMVELPDKADTTDDPEQQYVSAEFSVALFKTLTPRELECLRLRSHGMKYSEIAEVLSIRPGTVATLLSRCTTRIQQMLEGKANPEKLATKDDYVS
jgi:RNA polymerase sigma-70 factor (ECF subfamily)